MKKSTLIILIALSVTSLKAQDSLHVSGLVLPAYIYALTMNSYTSSGDSSKIGPAMRVLVTLELTQSLTYTTSITASSIPTITVADMYRTVYYEPAFYGAASTFKTALTAFRLTNNYLNTLCTAIETNASLGLVQQVSSQIQSWRGY